VEDHDRQRLLVALLERLLPTQYGPGDIIFHEGEIGRNVYFIINGEVPPPPPSSCETARHRRQSRNTTFRPLCRAPCRRFRLLLRPLPSLPLKDCAA